MKKKLLVLAAIAALGTAGSAWAAPQTTFEEGQTQIDLAASNVKASTNRGSTDDKWNFNGGLTYGLSDRWGVQYNYYGLKTKSPSLDSNSQEVNAIYSLDQNLAVYAGWNRIHNSLDGIDFGSKTNNVAQIGVIAKANLTDKLDVYGKAALGTQKTSLWEAGLGYSITQDLDVNAGYRYLNTKLTNNDNISYKGFIAGVSYRFGGSTESRSYEPAPAPTPAPVYEAAPAPAPAAETHEYKDYYVNSIHFDTDVDTPKASEQANLDQFVSTAKDNPNNTFKLVGNTDSQGNSAYNQDLSQRRVNNVKNYAVNHGVSASQLVTAFRGENDPASTNNTEEGRADNRRVDVYIVK
jgi:OOP family OmpA-OmpF porin